MFENSEAHRPLFSTHSVVIKMGQLHFLLTFVVALARSRNTWICPLSHDLNILRHLLLENVSDSSLSNLSQFAIAYLVKDGQQLIS